jgi:hypothetical protein
VEGIRAAVLVLLVVQRAERLARLAHTYTQLGQRTAGLTDAAHSGALFAGLSGRCEAVLGVRTAILSIGARAAGRKTCERQ